MIDRYEGIERERREVRDGGRLQGREKYKARKRRYKVSGGRKRELISKEDMDSEGRQRCRETQEVRDGRRGERKR